MKILIAAGASGGHVFPAIYTAQELKGRKHNIVFVTTRGLAENILRKNEFEAIPLAVKGISFSGPLKFFGSIVIMAKAFFQSLRIVRHCRPDVVMGFGGYAAFPVVLAAFFQGKPVIVHEQNVIPGRANRWAGRFAKKIALSFAQTKKYFSCGKTVWTGCPCRAEQPSENQQEVFKNFGLVPGKQTILVLGGSQGSHAINQEFLKTADLLKHSIDFQCIHLCGEKEFPALKQAYLQAKYPYCLRPFVDEMSQVYQIADVVLSRAGALTIFELMRFKKSSILVPYPFAGAHQKENAMVLVRVGVATIIDEAELSAHKLEQAIRKMLSGKMTKQDFTQRVESIFVPDAHQILAQVIEDAGAAALKR